MDSECLKGKKILIGITGGIAAYKTCSLIRLFKKRGAEVKIAATPNALNFITKTSIGTLSGNPLNVNQFDIDEYKPEHISLADWADIFIIAPASADTIAKAALGLCDNLLTSVFCAFRNPVIFAPSMNEGMWNNPAVQTLEKIIDVLDINPYLLYISDDDIDINETHVQIIKLLEKLKQNKKLYKRAYDFILELSHGI